MPAHKKISHEQDIVLINYMEAVGKIKRPFTKNDNAVLWKKIAAVLNSLPGDHRTPVKWRNYWYERKYIVRRKVAEGRTAFLKPYQRKLLSMIGSKAKSRSELKNDISSLDSKTDPEEIVLRLEEVGTDLMFGGSPHSVVEQDRELESPIEESNDNPDFVSDDPELSIVESRQEEDLEVKEEVNYDEMIFVPIEEVNCGSNEEVNCGSKEEVKFGSKEQVKCGSKKEVNSGSKGEVKRSSKKKVNSGSMKEINCDPKRNEEEDVPSWVREVENRRLNVEERTAAALEKMADAMTSMSQSTDRMSRAMVSMSRSMTLIENSLRLSDTEV